MSDHEKMMNDEQKKIMIRQLAADIKAAGFRVFIAERGTYGFYTDAEGSRVVSFEGAPFGGVSFTGCYVTSNPRQTCQGWRMQAADYATRFNTPAPEWALKGATWRPTTLAENLSAYQSSSKFTEV